MLTNTLRVKSAVIALTGRTAYSGFKALNNCRIMGRMFKLCYLLCLYTRGNLLNISIVRYHKGLLICFQV